MDNSTATVTDICGRIQKSLRMVGVILVCDFLTLLAFTTKGCFALSLVSEVSGYFDTGIMC